MLCLCSLDEAAWNNLLALIDASYTKFTYSVFFFISVGQSSTSHIVLLFKMLWIPSHC